jgi:hypothetical protein
MLMKIMDMKKERFCTPALAITRVNSARAEKPAGALRW